MSNVGVNPPKTPVTTGSNGVAAATVPNVCKMPGPPAPFIPTPLPNIARSGLDPKGFSKTVTINGHAVAIQGASFGSQGDMASKGTGGGLVSANTHGPAKFIGPGSMNVRIEGRNVQLLGDPMLNNCGPSGSPPNAATMAGLLQQAQLAAQASQTENPNTECASPGQAHRWEVQEARGQESLQSKIERAKADPAVGTQFEGRAAEHNMGTGELRRSSQLSGSSHAEKIFWKCAVCGMSREGDQTHDGATPGAAPIAVEVKSKTTLDMRDRIQLGRNIQAVKQGGASGLIYKVPAGRAGKYIAYSIRAIGKKTGCPIRIVRI